MHNKFIKVKVLTATMISSKSFQILIWKKLDDCGQNKIKSDIEISFSTVKPRTFLTKENISKFET